MCLQTILIGYNERRAKNLVLGAVSICDEVIQNLI